ERARRAEVQIAKLTARAEETRAQLADISQLPGLLAEKRRNLMDALQRAESDRRLAADRLADGENTVRVADQALRGAQDRQAEAREAHARLGVRLDSSRERHDHTARRIREVLLCAPEDVLSNSSVDPGKIPHGDELERRLVNLREDRERLGGVNLRAEEEAEEVARQLDGLVRERDDLTQAIAKLRAGVGSLNREGRQRLLDAFDTVNANFSQLFTTLFGGGKAELQLIESEDPLEAGLEIL